MKTEAEIKERMEKFMEDDYDASSELTYRELLQWVLDPSPVAHVGKESRRCEEKYEGWLNKEKVFAEAWQKTNDPPSFLNSGIGTLTWLLCGRFVKGSGFGFGGGDSHRITRHLTQEEATAAASAIQWLGTNCGWCWLEECVRACGFDIVHRRKAATPEGTVPYE